MCHFVVSSAPTWYVWGYVNIVWEIPHMKTIDIGVTLVFHWVFHEMPIRAKSLTILDFKILQLKMNGR